MLMTALTMNQDRKPHPQRETLELELNKSTLLKAKKLAFERGITLKELLCSLLIREMQN
jgi:hypothetical protein